MMQIASTVERSAGEKIEE